MENDENVAKKLSTGLHSTQSQPIIFGAGSDDEGTQGAQSKNSKTSKEKKEHSKDRRVSFASSSQLTQYLEPINPFESFAIPIANAQELSCLYQLSCEKHKTIPIPVILEHLESLNLDKSKARTEVLSLKQQTLTHESCEALEELFKRVKYRAIDVTSCSLDDSSASSLFDMIEYYEACNELNISENPNIKNRGWLACINMIKRSQALHSLATRGTPISDSNALTLGNALTISYIYTLKLENCGLSGRPILCLSGALQKNRVLKELCLANNEMNANDAYNVGNILKNNYHLQLLDISNNDIQDEGFRHIAEALSYQSVHVSKTSSIDSLSSASLNKFDFSDLTANLNNINNNRNRFSPTPPLTPLKVDSAGSIHHRNESNVSSLNNNSILQQCDSESRGGGVHKRQMSDGENVAVTTDDESTKSTNKDDASSSNDSAGKFKYTPESLSPISHGYELTPNTNQIFNSRSPERSFSSESLCSETSVESNDSKSSIRLIESKFSNRNGGTLERQQQQQQQKNNEISSLVTSTNEQEGMSGSGASNEKPPTGLQVLILWNNNLTSACSESAAYLLDCTKFLQIINFGHNSIGNEFLVDTRSSLRTNDSLSSIGLQATNLTCDGLKVLAEILQFGGNSILQRIDLRSNNLSVMGLSALSEALKSNKSVIRVDLDDAPKSDDMLPLHSEIQRLVNTIRQQCSYNENPVEQQEIPKATTVPRPKRTNINNNFNGRKISLTCSNVVKTTPPTPPPQPSKQLLEPIKKQANNRLRSPSPTLSPLSPLASPSRNRFQVSRVSESSSSGISSKSPSSSSSSPTFFPTTLSSSSSSSRFRVVTVSEPLKKVETPLPPKVIALKTEASKEIDIPVPSQKVNFLNSSTSSSIASSQSCEQLDHYNVKKFIDLGDSCSSFSSIDSIDHHTDVSSNESFDMIEKSPMILTNDKHTAVFYDEILIDVDKSDDELILTMDGECKKENALQSNENTLTKSTSSSSSSNEGLTLTTNSPTELSPKQEPNKRTRKTSWIQSAIGGGSAKDSAPIYPATLDKLLNLFHHPTSLFTKSSPPAAETTTIASLPSSSSSSNKPPIAQKPNIVSRESSSGMGQKESSISGFIHSIVALTSHKKETSESSILQNISPENTIEKSSSHSQMLLESLPKSIKMELKENISPENTISCENLAAVEQKQRPQATRVLFVVGDEEDLSVSEDSCLANEEFIDDDVGYDKENSTLGDITRDSMTILKANSSGDQKMD